MEREALNLALEYMNERLGDHDSKFMRHLAPEAPPQRTWVGLTQEEVEQFHNWKDCTWSTNELVRYVEATLRSKNT